MKDEFLKIFSTDIRKILSRVDADPDRIQEIRMRVTGPLLMTVAGREYFVTKSGELTTDRHRGYPVSERELAETMEYISGYSMYACEEELRKGFLTISGGHRVGVAGKIIMSQGAIRSMKYISFLNVRVCHEVKGCADVVLPYLIRQEEICHTLIVSPPGCGKTTLLRDMIRQISNGNRYCRGHTVGVIDERSEIGGAYHGIPQNDLGIRTDLLDGCPKAEGMMMLIRSMAPRVIAVDEIGTAEDVRALETSINCGCRILATVHANSMDELWRKPLVENLMKNKVFERYILLDNQGGIGTIRGILDENGKHLLEGRGQGA